MPLVRRVRSRGANFVIEADGEVLFGPTGPVPGWTRVFSNRIRGGVERSAPSNKRPRWGHYGLPLKRTIRVSSRSDPARKRAYAAVGSTAPHALYVDQGTGIYGEGSGPYEAKILPPTQHGAPDLYEHTWDPSLRNKNRYPLMIRGQKGQGFFERGLQIGFAAQRVASVNVPGAGGKINDAVNKVPDYILGFLGNTASTPAFRASLDEWRAWRDSYFDSTRHQRAGRNLRTGRASQARKGARYKRSPDERKAAAAARSKAYRARMKRNGLKPRPRKSDPTKKPGRPKNGYETVAQKKAAALAQFTKQNPGVKINRSTPIGIEVQTSSGAFVISWAQLYNLI